MRKVIAMLLTFALCVQMVSQLAVTTEASPEKEICDTAWNDDFSTDTISNYKVAGPDTGAWGNWQVVDGKMQVTGNAPSDWWGTSLLLKDVIYDNFVMEFDADVSAGYGIILRAQDDATTANSGLNAWHSGNAYVIMHWSPVENNASVQILDYNGSKDGEVLANVGSVGAMTSAHWKIIATGNDIIISLTDNNNADNKLTYNLSDTRYASGMIGLYNLTKDGVTSFKMDNLSVTPINSTLHENTFDTNDLSDYFVAGPNNGIWGNWQAVDSKLQVTGNAGAQWWGTSLLTDADYDNFVMEFDADVSAGYGIFLRAQDDAAIQGSGLNAWFSGDTYAVVHYRPIESDASVQIMNFSGAENVLAHVGDFSVNASTSVHWKVVAWGNTLYVKLTDNSNAANSVGYVLTDSTYAAGHIGFYNLTAEGVTSLKVDNLTIKGEKPATGGEEPEPPSITEPEAKITWTDDMNSGKGDKYTAYGLWWNNAVSAMTQTDYTGVLGNEGGSVDGITYYYLNDYKFEDFVMEFDVVSTAPGSQYGVVLRAGNPGDGADQGDGYTVMYDGSWVFAGKLNGQFTQLTTTPTAYAYNPSDHGETLTHWKVVCVGENIAVYFNGSTEPAIWVTDATYTAGSVGLRTFAPAGVTSNVVIDNLSIKGTGIIPIVEPEAKITWTDDMNSGKGDKYTAYGLWWNNAVSAMTQTDYTGVLGNEGGSVDGITYYYLNDYKFEDFVMEFDVVSTAPGSQYGVVLRAGNPGDGADQGDGYTVMYDGSWVFAGKLNGQFTQLTTTPTAYVYNPSDHGVTITHWKVVCVGENIAVYFNGSTEPAIWVTDATYTAGSVGLRAFAPAGVTSNVVIDNLSINGTGTYEKPEDDDPLPPELETYDFEWHDEFESETYNAYLAYGRWWNNATSEFNRVDYSDILANEGGIADGVCYYYLRKYKWADFEMEFDVPSTHSTAQYGVVLRASTYSDAPDDCGGYTVMYDGSWIFVGKLNGSFVQVTNTSSAYAYNPSEHGITPEHWKITCVGNKIEVYLNGSVTPIISVKDSDFNCGYVGFRTFAKGGDHTNVVFDNLHIKGSVLVEELTTRINSNRRSGTLYDYSTLVESAKKTDKVVVKEDSTSSDTVDKEDTSNNTDNKGNSSNKVNTNSSVNKTDTTTGVSDKTDTSEESKDQNDVTEEEKNETEKDAENKSENVEADDDVSIEEISDGNTHRWIIPTAIIALLVVVAAEVIIIAKKRKK